MKSQYGNEDYTYNLSDLDYKTPRKNIIKGLERMNYGRHYEDEDLDMYLWMQLTIDENEYFLGYEFIDAKTIDYEIKPGIYEQTDLNAAFPKNLEVKESR